MRLRVAEVRKHTVAHVLGNEATRFVDLVSTAAMVRANDLAHVLGVEPSRERGRTNKVAEHDRELSAFSFGSLAAGAVGFYRTFGRLAKSLGSQCGDGIEENAAM